LGAGANLLCLRRNGEHRMRIEVKNECDDSFLEKAEKDFSAILAKESITLKSMLIYKENAIIYEKYWGHIDQGDKPEVPNSQYALQRMYSVSKSVVSIAVGLLVDDGKLKLTDRIVDYYELLTGKTCLEFDKKLSRVTIGDMLSMRSSHSKTTYKHNYENNWVESFFNIPSDKEPGDKFDYETSASHVLAALIEKTTGKSILSFIRERMPELELSDEAYIMRDPFGVEMGGTGLMCTVRDLLKLAIMILNEGEIEGHRLLSREYIINATAKQVDTKEKAKFPFEGCGYGYGFWRHEHGGYMCYGLNGQLVYFLPNRRMIIITTADTSQNAKGTQILLDEINNLANRI